MLAQARNTLTIIKGNVYIRIAWILVILNFQMKAQNEFNDSN